MSTGSSCGSRWAHAVARASVCAWRVFGWRIECIIYAWENAWRLLCVCVHEWTSRIGCLCVRNSMQTKEIISPQSVYLNTGRGWESFWCQMACPNVPILIHNVSVTPDLYPLWLHSRNIARLNILYHEQKPTRTSFWACVSHSHFSPSSHQLTDVKSKACGVTSDPEREACGFMCIFFFLPCAPVLTWLQPCKLIGCSYLDVSSGPVLIVTVSMAVSRLISPTTPTHIPLHLCFLLPCYHLTYKAQPPEPFRCHFLSRPVIWKTKPS